MLFLPSTFATALTSLASRFFLSCLHRDPRPRSLLFKPPSVSTIIVPPLVPLLPPGVPTKTPRITPVPSPSQRQRGLRWETPADDYLLLFYLFVYHETYSYSSANLFHAASVLFLLVPERSRACTMYMYTVCVSFVVLTAGQFIVVCCTLPDAVSLLSSYRCISRHDSAFSRCYLFLSF